MATFIRVPRINTGDVNTYTLSLFDVPVSASQETLPLLSVAVQPTRNLERKMIAEIEGTPEDLVVGETYAVEVVRDSDGFIYADGYIIYRDDEESPGFGSSALLQVAENAANAVKENTDYDFEQFDNLGTAAPAMRFKVRP